MKKTLLLLILSSFVFHCPFLYSGDKGHKNSIQAGEEGLWDSFSAGSGKAVSTDFNIIGSIGQPVIFASQSDSYDISQGFWTLPDSLFTEVKPVSGKEIDIKVSVYPNPAGEIFYLNITSFERPDASIELYSSDGRKAASIYEGRLENTLQLRCATGMLTSGTYFLIIKSGDSILYYTLKIMK